MEYDIGVGAFGLIPGGMQKEGSMPRSPETARKIFLLIVVFCALSLAAQKGQANQPKYDLSTETKMTGTIEEVQLPPKENRREIAHLLLKSGTDTADVYLCPRSFLDDMGVSFNKADEITLTGSKIKQGDADLILAREVVRGTDTLVLRDAKGKPVW